MNQALPYQSAFWWKKGVAAVTTALAAFCLLAFLASLTVHDIESAAFVDVSTSGTNAEPFIRQLINSELADGQLMDHVQSTTSDGRPVVNEDIANHNLEAVRAALDIQLARQGDTQSYRLTATYAGRGTACERFLVDQIVNALNRRMNTGQSAGRTALQINQQYSKLHENMANSASSRQVELASAVRQLEQLNLSLSALHEDVEAVLMDRPASAFSGGTTQALNPEVQESLTRSLNSLRDGLQRLDASGFHPAFEPLNQAAGEISHTLGPLLQENATATESVRGSSSPMRVVNASLGPGGPLNRVLDSIEALDIDTIKSRLLQTQQNLRSDALETRNQIISLNAATKEMSENRIVVDAISAVRTAPADAGPRPAMLLMFGLFAIAFGAAVAFRYKPELVDVGFDSADDAARSIGLPLVSAIHVDPAEVAGRGKKDSIANSIVRVCEIGLTGFVLLTVVLCLTIPEIRSAFVENPIFGLSRIGELFFGS